MKHTMESSHFRSLRLKARRMFTAGLAPVAIIALLIASLALASCSNPASGSTTVEEGTESNPHLIDSAADLNAMRGGVTDGWDLDDFYKLTADIDLADYGDWTPIGSVDFPFTGTLDGNGHAIKNLTITSASGQRQGFFGDIGNGGKIHDLGLEAITIDITSGNNVGGLAGYAEEGSAISDCHSAGTVSGYFTIGGLVGCESGAMTDCYSTCDVSADSNYAGGLIGGNEGTVSGCYSKGGTVTGPYCLGGLAGVSYSAGTIANCYSMDAVTASGTSSSTRGPGGFVGRNFDESTITNCYSTGTVSGTGGCVGGFVGVNTDADITDCFYDSETSGMNDTDRGTPKTTAEMKAQATYSGWDFDTVWGITDTSINSGYPYLRWQK
jgi:hypothetical protein